MKRLLVGLLALTLAAAPTVARAGDGSSPRRSERRHVGLGLTLGAIAGTILGGWATLELCSECRGAGPFFSLWTAFAVGGALGGYAAGGGFSADTDQALDRGREAVRQAGMAAPGAAPALGGLRLAFVPGVEGLRTADEGEGDYAKGTETRGKAILMWESCSLRSQ